jgi:serine/threonine protein kinase
LDKVGVYARVDPFPDVATVPCQKRVGCTILTAQGQPVPATNGTFTFDVLRPNNLGQPGPYSGSGRCYAEVQLLKKAIYGCVKLAHVVNVVPGAQGATLLWTDERVAIKCISKAVVRRMQQSGNTMNENPLKEVRCLSYITRRMSGTLAGPEAIRGEPKYVLPMVDCLEDSEYMYLVMPCLEEEMFTVVEQKGGPFSEPQARDYLAQILGGLEG